MCTYYLSEKKRIGMNARENILQMICVRIFVSANKKIVRCLRLPALRCWKRMGMQIWSRHKFDFNWERIIIGAHTQRMD